MSNYEDYLFTIFKQSKKNSNPIIASEDYTIEKWYAYKDLFLKDYALIKKNNKYNVIDREGNILFSTWYDKISISYNNSFIVTLDGSLNVITNTDKILYNKWIKDNIIQCYSNNTLLIVKDRKYNIVLKDGSYLFDEWYDSIQYYNGIYIVQKDRQSNFSNIDGILKSDGWYRSITPFENNKAIVELRGKFNIIDINNKLLFNEWYDSIDYGSLLNGDNDVLVCNNDKYNFINKNNEYLFNNWLYSATPFNKNISIVAFERGKYNIVDTTGKILSAVNYDYIEENDNFLIVSKDGLKNVIDRKGNLLLNKWYNKFDQIIDNKTGLLNSNGFYSCGDNEYINLFMHSVHYEQSMFGYRYYNAFESQYDKIKYVPCYSYPNYVLCTDKNNLYIYNKILNEYELLASNFDELKLVVKENYFIYDGYVFYINEYFYKHLGKINVYNYIIDGNANSFKSYEEFYNLTKVDQDKLSALEEYKKRDIASKLENEQQIKQEKIKSIDEIIKKYEGTVKSNLLDLSDKIKEKESLTNSNSVTNKRHDVPLNLLFDMYSDHREFKKEFTGKGILRLINLSLVDFTKTKISNIDLSYSNAFIDPQKVYDKDMSNGIYSGMDFSFKSFDGVNICGSDFSDCYYLNTTGAIMDESTILPKNNKKDGK